MKQTIKELEYDKNKKELKVRFGDNKAYSFNEVEEKIIDELEISKSMDDYFDENIRGQYESKKIEDSDQMICS